MQMALRWDTYLVEGNDLPIYTSHVERFLYRCATIFGAINVRIRTNLTLVQPKCCACSEYQLPCLSLYDRRTTQR